jgi:hypothetical protein
VPGGDPGSARLPVIVHALPGRGRCPGPVAAIVLAHDRGWTVVRLATYVSELFRKARNGAVHPLMRFRVPTMSKASRLLMSTTFAVVDAALRDECHQDVLVSSRRNTAETYLETTEPCVRRARRIRSTPSRCSRCAGIGVHDWRRITHERPEGRQTWTKRRTSARRVPRAGLARDQLGGPARCTSAANCSCVGVSTRSHTCIVEYPQLKTLTHSLSYNVEFVTSLHVDPGSFVIRRKVTFR